MCVHKALLPQAPSQPWGSVQPTLLLEMACHACTLTLTLTLTLSLNLILGMACLGLYLLGCALDGGDGGSHSPTIMLVLGYS